MAETIAPIANDLAVKSRSVRRTIVEMAHRAHCGHVGSALSTVDILSVLYHSFLRIDPTQPQWADRDRFILSKGHGCTALYATLAQRGFFPVAELETFLRDGTLFAGHPSARHVPGVELSTGSLGHGINVGIGMALAGKRGEKNYRTVVLVSDGECDEGSTWEAALTAGFWKLNKLIVIVDYNKIQSFGRVADIMELEPFAAKWTTFNWHVQEINGHDHAEIARALSKATEETQRPSVIIAHTIKGKGVSFMEDTVDWHYWPPSDDQKAKAFSELCD